jgi:hypothetical protein
MAGLRVSSRPLGLSKTSQRIDDSEIVETVGAGAAPDASGERWPALTVIAPSDRTADDSERAAHRCWSAIWETNRTVGCRPRGLVMPGDRR